MKALTALSAVVILVAACSGGGSGGNSGGGGGSVAGSTSRYSVGGVLSGLSETVVLQNNGTDDLLAGTNGPFAFPSSLADGTTYAVTVKAQPPGQVCIVGNSTGVISGANVTSVTVTCKTAYSVGGVLSGLSETIVLQNNSTDDLSVGTNGPFTFPASLAEGGTYEVTVKTQPPSQICVVGNGTGTISGANVTSVTVTCEAALAWDAPVSDIDGSIVTSVAGYKLYYGTGPGIYTGSIDVGNATRYAIAAFSAAVPQGATYYITVTAYDADRTTESACSNETTRTID